MRLPSLLPAFLLLPAWLLSAAEPLRISGQILPLAAKAEVAVYAQCESFEEARKRLADRGLPAPLIAVSPDKTGAFSLELPAALRLTVVARAPGFVPHTYDWWHEEGAVKFPSIELEPAQPRVVTLVDAAGQALPGVRVGHLPAIISDAEGRVTLQEGKERSTSLFILDSRFLGPVQIPADGRVVLRPLNGVVLQVRDPRGKPVPRALIRLGPLALGLTDDKGRFAVESMNPSGLLQIGVEGPSGEWAELDIRARPEREVLPVTLAPVEKVAGRVVDAVTREPIAGAVVSNGLPCPSAAVTTADGAFRLTWPQSSRGLSASAPGYRSNAWPMKAGHDDLTLALQRESELAGFVVDEAGQPVAGARLACRASTLDELSNECDPALVSGKNGSFLLRKLAAGTDYVVTASLDGYTPVSATRRIPRPGETAEPLRLTLTRGSRLMGRVVDEQGRPIAAEVELRLFVSGRGRDALQARADAEGRFAFHTLAAGSYTLTVRSRGFTPVVTPSLEIAPAVSPLDLSEIQLGNAAVVEGQVVDPRGRPVAGAGITAEWQQRNGAKPFASSSTVSGADGRFRLEDLAPGERYRLTGEAPGFAASLPLEVVAPTEEPQEPVSLTLRAQRVLSGRVVDAQGEPVEAMVTIMEEGRGEGRPTDSHGRFSRLVPAGRLDVAISASGRSERTLRGIEIPLDRDPVPLEIVLASGSLLLGRVTDREGSGQARVSVSAFSNDEALSRAWAITDADGSYRLEGLAPGEYEVSASFSFARSVKRQVRLGTGEQRLDLVLPDVQAVRGRVVDESGAPVGRVEIQWNGNRAGYQAVSASDGTFVIPELPPGTYTVVLRSAGVQGKPISGLVVEAGGEKEWILDFVPADPAP